jgi:uracil-DNA glycosylase family 4
MPITYESHCTGCPYFHAAHLSSEFRSVRSAPLSKESRKAPVLLIFQAPGEIEWRTGAPISNPKPGSAGARLDKAFIAVGKTREDFDITNTVQCFPGKHTATARDKPPTAAARSHCSNWLRDDIAGGVYTRIVVFGSHAKKAVHRLGYKDDSRFHFVKHPSGGLSNAELLEAVG